MLRQICFVLAVAAAVRAQSPVLPYYQAFSNDYIVTWGLTNTSIELQLDVNTNGWVSFALVSNDGTMLDVWWGGFDEDYATNYGQDGFAQFSNLQSGPRYPDTLQNLNLVSIQQAPFGETTRLRFTRSFTTIDYKQDVAIPLNERQIVYWAYGVDDLPSTPPAASGFAQIILRPLQ